MDSIKQQTIENNSPHWTDGGTGVTNLSDAEQVDICQKAIQEYGDDNLFIVDRAMLKADGRDPNWSMAGALHCTSRGNLSKFWRVYDIIKDTRSA